MDDRSLESVSSPWHLLENNSSSHVKQNDRDKLTLVYPPNKFAEGQRVLNKCGQKKNRCMYASMYESEHLYSTLLVTHKDALARQQICLMWMSASKFGTYDYKAQPHILKTCMACTYVGVFLGYTLGTCT